jgi:prolyl-tRNA editing enzyme YbaK/EbsC (Cys-tRNA(Pro) deacylase)
MRFGTLDAVAATEKLDLLAESTAREVQAINAPEIQVVQIDPALADTAAFCAHYGIGLNHSANCVVVEATRGEKTWLAACVILASTRADVNGLVRRHLGARRVSFAPMEKALAETKMEYGGITPVGLPSGWPLLIDSRVASSDWVVVGSGIRGSKLILPGKIFAGLPNAVTLENLGKEIVLN